MIRRAFYGRTRGLCSKQQKLLPQKTVIWNYDKQVYACMMPTASSYSKASYTEDEINSRGIGRRSTVGTVKLVLIDQRICCLAAISNS